MQFNFKSWWKRFVAHSKYRWENHKESIMINFGIFLFIVLITLLIDQLTKGLLFQWNEDKTNGNGLEISSNAFITITSVANPGLTFLGNNFLWLAHLSAILVIIAIPLMIYFVDSKFLTLILAFLFSGSTGNFIDRLIYNGLVRDIIQFTFLKDVNFFGGVFNFADVFASFAAILGIIFVIKIVIVDYKAKH